MHVGYCNFVKTHRIEDECINRTMVEIAERMPHMFMVHGDYFRNEWVQIDRWCQETYGSGDRDGRWCRYWMGFFFARDDDALLFKMRWQ